MQLKFYSFPDLIFFNFFFFLFAASALCEEKKEIIFRSLRAGGRGEGTLIPRRVMVSAGMAASVLNPRIPRESEQEEPIISPSSSQHHPGYKHAKAGHRKDVKMGQIGHKSSTVYQIWVTPVQFENWKKGWTRKFNPFSTALSEALYFTPFKLVDQNHIHKKCVFFWYHVYDHVCFHLEEKKDGQVSG